MGLHVLCVALFPSVEIFELFACTAFIGNVPGNAKFLSLLTFLFFLFLNCLFFSEFNNRT